MRQDVPKNNKSFLKRKHEPAYLYFLLDNGQIVYVGRSRRVFDRFNVHLKSKLFTHICIYRTTHTNAWLTETALINFLTPKYNISHANKPRKTDISTIMASAFRELVPREQRIRQYVQDRS